MSERRPHRVFATAATCERVDGGVGTIWWAHTPRGEFLLRVLDYDLAPMQAVNDKFVEALFQRSAELVGRNDPLETRCITYCEAGGLLDQFRLAVRASFSAGVALDRNVADIALAPAQELAKWPPTLDGRAAMVRPLVNSGTTIRLETGLRQFSFRAIRTNHLIAAIKNHRPGAPETATELMNAFVLGIMLARASDRRSQLPAFTQAPAAAEGGMLARLAEALRNALSGPRAPEPAEEEKADRVAEYQRELATWRSEYDAKLAAARARPGADPLWVPMSPQHLGVRAKPVDPRSLTHVG